MSLQAGNASFAASSENPFNWSKNRKRRILLISCLLTFLVGFNASAPTTAFPEISHELGVPDGSFETPFFMVTSWNLAAGLFPMVTLSLMDTYGTYYTYIISYCLFLVFVLPQALAQNFSTLIVVRFFAGGFGGTLQNGVEAVVANLFDSRDEQVLAITLFIVAYVGGVTLGPVQGAFTQILGWRWVFWLQLIVYGAILPLVVFGLEETRGSTIKARLAKNTASLSRSVSKGSELTHEVLGTLLRSGKLLVTEFIVFSFMLWCAFSYGLIFISTESIAIVYGTIFGFESYQTGLLQAAMFVGELVGAVVYIVFRRNFVTPTQNHQTEQNIEKETIERTGDLLRSQRDNTIEKELYLSVPATIIGLSGGLFIYAWTGYKEGVAPWMAPAIGLALQGFAVMVILIGATFYLTECYGIYAASAIGAIAVGENIFAAFLPLASLPMYENLGFQWASSLLACVGLILVVPPLLLIWKGPGIRGRSKAIEELGRQ